MRITLFFPNSTTESILKEKCEFCVEQFLAKNFYRRVIVDDSGIASKLLVIHELSFLGFTDNELIPILSFLCKNPSRLIIVTLD